MAGILGAMTRCLLLVPVVLTACSAFPCGRHDVGDRRHVEACGVLGSWGARPLTGGEATWMVLEPWGAYTRDEAGRVERPGFLLAWDDAWTAEETALPSDQVLAACMDMGVLLPTDDVQIEIVREASRGLGDTSTSYVVDWDVRCGEWQMTSSGRDVIEFKRDSEDWEDIAAQLGLPPQRVP